MNFRKEINHGVKRILIVKMWALGDILMATPLLRALKTRYPDCEITWFAERSQAPILENNPLIDELIAFDSASWRRDFRYGKLVSYLRTSRSMRRGLLQRRFDVVINLTAEKWWSAWFTVAPRRVGVFPREKAGLIGRLYTDIVERRPKPWLHNSQHYLLGAAALGIEGPYDERMVVGVTDLGRATVTEFLESNSSYDPSKPLIVIHPGTSQASKCWPPEQYASLARHLNGYNVVVTGSAGESELARSIARDAGRAVIVGAGSLTHLGQTAALIERAVAIVTGDTSALHIASALDVPVVGIYGSTRPRDNAPLFGRSELLYDDNVPCAPCYKAKCPLHGAEHMRCMKEVDVTRVLAALADLGLTIETPAAEHNTTESDCNGASRA